MQLIVVGMGTNTHSNMKNILEGVSQTRSFASKLILTLRSDQVSPAVDSL